MIIAGVTAYAELYPKPRAIPAIDWLQLDSGAWRPTVRGIEADQYFADLSIYDNSPVIEALWNALKNPSNRGQISLTFSNTLEAMIWGADVLCTTATVWKYGVPVAAGFTGLNTAMYRLSLSLRAISPSFTGTGAWPAVMRVQSWKTGSSFDLSKIASFSGSISYPDHRGDTPYFEGEFRALTEEMKQVRRFIYGVNRGAQTTFPDIGVPYPFGPDLGGFTDSYVRVIYFEDLGQDGFETWRFKLGLSYDGQTS